MAILFLPGDVHLPIVYEVDRIRDGGSFTTRRVVAIQKGRPIFNMAASFQLVQEGMNHQSQMPEVAAPDGLMTDVELSEALGEKLPPPLKEYQNNRPIEFRPVEKYSLGSYSLKAMKN